LHEFVDLSVMVVAFGAEDSHASVEIGESSAHGVVLGFEII